MRDMAKKKANDARRHKERMETDLDFRLQRLLNCIRHRCLSGKGRKDQQYYLGLPVTITLEDLKMVWNRDGAGLMRRPDVDRKEGHLGYTPDNIQFLEHADNMRKMIATRKPRGKARRFSCIVKSHMRYCVSDKSNAHARIRSTTDDQ